MKALYIFSIKIFIYYLILHLYKAFLHFYKDIYLLSNFCISIKIFIYYLISQKIFTLLSSCIINGVYKLKELELNN